MLIIFIAHKHFIKVGDFNIHLANICGKSSNNFFLQNYSKSKAGAKLGRLVVNPLAEKLQTGNYVSANRK